MALVEHMIERNGVFGAVLAAFMNADTRICQHLGVVHATRAISIRDLPSRAPRGHNAYTVFDEVYDAVEDVWNNGNDFFHQFRWTHFDAGTEIAST